LGPNAVIIIFQMPASSSDITKFDLTQNPIKSWVQSPGFDFIMAAKKARR